MNKIPVLEVSKLINKKNVRYIPNYYVRKIEEAEKNGHSMKSGRKNLVLDKGTCIQ